MGSPRHQSSASTGVDVPHGGSSAKGGTLAKNFNGLSASIGGHQKHRVCLMDRDGQIIDQRWIEHSGKSLAELVDWLGKPRPQGRPRGSRHRGPPWCGGGDLIDHGFAVFSINPETIGPFPRPLLASGSQGRRARRFCVSPIRCEPTALLPCGSTRRSSVIRLRDLSRLEDEYRRGTDRVNNRFASNSIGFSRNCSNCAFGRRTLVVGVVSDGAATP